MQQNAPPLKRMEKLKIKKKKTYLLEVFAPVGVRFSPEILLELVLSSPSFFEKSFLNGSVFTCKDDTMRSEIKYESTACFHKSKHY